MIIKEKRFSAGGVSLRAEGDGKNIGGYALKFNTLSQNLGGYVESCAPGLADKSIADRADVVCRWLHEDQYTLGSVGAGTLDVRADGTGVEYDCPLPDTTYARDVAALAARGDLRYSSFAFRVLDDEWSETETGFPLRTLKAIQLIDVAPVTRPAYIDTSTGLRTLAEQRSLDLDAVKKAAASNHLAELLREHEPTHIDLGGQGETHPVVSIRQRMAALDLIRTTP